MVVYELFQAQESASRRAAAEARAAAHRQRVALGADGATRALGTLLRVVERGRTWEATRQAHARTAGPVCEAPVRARPA